MYETSLDHLNIFGLPISLHRIINVDELYANLVSKGDEHEDVKDERIPYWAELWPSAIALGEHLVQSKCITPGKRVHEMGCGLGLPGIIAGKLGAEVLFTDYLDDALAFARQNWELNVSVGATFKKMDWRNPAASLQADLLLASDVAYERRSFEYLPNAFKALVNPCGKIIVSEPNRLYAQEFFNSLRFIGFDVTHFNYPVQMHNITHNINVFEILTSTRASAV
jgi:predicted nicotinamide N-methyase